MESSQDSGDPQRSVIRRQSRVPRACDECRWRKAKCDGRSPCDRCSSFGRECTYASKSRITTGAQRIQSLEDQLRSARDLISRLKSRLPDSVGNDPDPPSPTLESMMDGQGRIVKSERRSHEYFGPPSGFVFLRRTQQLFDESQDKHDGIETFEADHRAIRELFDGPQPHRPVLDTNTPFQSLLPHRHTVAELLDVAFGQAYPLIQFLDEHQFLQQTDRIFDLEPMDFEDSDHDFLPLLYAVLAIGYLFSKRMHQKYGCNGAVTQAMRHFIAARQIVDLTSCRDLVSLQCLICLVVFLLATARLTNAYTFLGLAVTSSAKLGLHYAPPVNPGPAGFDLDIESRAFWTLVQLDVYLSSVLGLPGLINLKKVTQNRPMIADRDRRGSVGDVNIVEYSPVWSISAYYLDVLLIIAEAISVLYPNDSKNIGTPEQGGNLRISYRKIREIENNLDQSQARLSDVLNLDVKSLSAISIHYELEMLHSFARIVLYRPFLHYLVEPKQAEHPDPRQKRCALACIETARQAIARSSNLVDQGYLCAASWCSIYTIFLSVVALVFFLATQTESEDAVVVRQSARDGIRILCSTSCCDTGSKRCLDVLRVLIKRLSHRTQLDIEQIWNEVESLCRTSAPGEKSRDDREQTYSTPVPLASHDMVTSLSSVQDFKTRGGAEPSFAKLAQEGDSSDDHLWKKHTSRWAVPGEAAYREGSPLAATPETSDAMDVQYADQFSWSFPSHTLAHRPSQTTNEVFENNDMTAVDISAFMKFSPAGESPRGI